MKYVIQDTSVPQGSQRLVRYKGYYGYYVYNAKLITRDLYNAKQFKSKKAAEKFILKSTRFSEYTVVNVSEKDLFKARLAGI